MSSKYTKVSEEKLIKEVLQGDIQAYGELYKRYLDEIYRYVYYRVANNHLEAEDLTQVVFIRSWEVISKNRPKKYNFRSLVYKIAHNLIVDRWRTQRQELSLEKEKVESLPNLTPMLEQLILSKEGSHDLAVAIRELEPRLQHVIICRFVNGLSHAETAQTLGLTEGHVRVLQYRALKKIRVLIK